MKEQNIIFSLIVVQLSILCGCAQKTIATGDSGAAFVIASASDNGTDGGDNSGDDSNNLVAPGNVVLTAVNGKPGVIASQTTKKYIRVQWTNSVPDPTANIVIQSRLSSESTFVSVGSVPGNISVYNYDLGAVGTDRAYVFRLKTVKGASESFPTPIQQVSVTKSQLVTPDSWSITTDSLNLLGQWTYPTYDDGEHIGFRIEYVVFFTDGSTAPGGEFIFSTSVTDVRFDPCAEFSDRSIVYRIDSRIYAVPSNSSEISPSNPTPYRTFYGCAG